ncbi:MAG: ABC transporter permease subunit [Chloroflexi bacterium]|nr:ABC transporter permease subunit [Chloroflexota bacterium]
MLRFIVNRLLLAIPTVLLVSILVFLMLHLIPGDPAQIYIGDKPSTPAMLEKIREDMGLNKPLTEQYLDYMIGVLHGDFGKSLNNNRPILNEILLRLPSTLELTLAALLIAMTLGIGLGIVAAINHNTIIDTIATTIALIGISLPVYWSSLLLIVVFSIDLKWFPPIGQGGINRLVLPAAALGFLSAGALARIVRSGMLEVLHQDYVLTARSKGLAERLIIRRHALRNALIPVVTLLGLTFGELLGGAVLTETIFARLGIGRMYIEGILNKDYTLVQGATLFIAIAYVVINIFIDLIYVYVDPRIKYD